MSPREAQSSGDQYEALVARLLAGDRHALARAITLVESTRADHRIDAEAVIDRVLPFAGKSIRIGDTLRVIIRGIETPRGRVELDLAPGPAVGLTTA